MERVVLGGVIITCREQEKEEVSEDGNGRENKEFRYMEEKP